MGDRFLRQAITCLGEILRDEMWKRAVRGAATIAVGLGVWLVAGDASAFCRLTTCDPNRGEDCRTNDNGCIRDGVPLKWKSLPIVYRFHRSGSEKLDDSGMRAAVRRAFDEWENVECNAGRTSLRFQEGSDIDDDKPIGVEEVPEKFGIYFRDDEWPHDNSEESLAMTNQLYGKDSGRIDYADIEVNTALTNFRLTDDEDKSLVDLQAVMTHEVGHYIGLAHSNDPESIMVTSYCQNNDRCGDSTDRARQLSDDDRAAVCAAYEPSAGSRPVATDGCSQLGAYRSSDSVVNGLALLFLSSAIVRRRLRTSSA